MSPEVPGRIPGIAAAAATLGFVEATLALAAVVLVLGDTVDSGPGDERLLTLVLLEGLVLLAALTLLGSLSVVRETGRRLLVGVTIAELGLALAFVVLAMVVLATNDPSPFSEDGEIAATSVLALVAPTVRLALVTRPAVGTWVAASRRAAPGWPGPWGPVPRWSPGAVVAVLAPAVLLAVAVVVVVLTAEEPPDIVTGGGVPPVVVGPVAG